MSRPLHSHCDPPYPSPCLPQQRHPLVVCCGPPYGPMAPAVPSNRPPASSPAQPSPVIAAQHPICGVEGLCSAGSTFAICPSPVTLFDLGGLPPIYRCPKHAPCCMGLEGAGWTPFREGGVVAAGWTQLESKNRQTSQFQLGHISLQPKL